MMHFSGAKITGINGTVLVKGLSARLDQEAIQAVSSKYKSQQSFSPWMSSEDLFNDAVVKSDLIVLSKDELKNRGLLLTLGAESNLARLDKNHLKGQMVMPEDHPDYDQFCISINRALNIMGSHPVMKLRSESLISEIIPQVSNTDKPLRFNGSGLSSLKYRKGIFLSLPRSEDTRDFDLALNLSHELGHQTLMTYQNFDRIILDDHDTPVYSVIRECHRPAILSFHAMVAVIHMLEFLALCKDELLKTVDSNYFQSQYKNLLNSLRITLKDFNRVRFTTLGKQMMYEAAAFYMWSEKSLCKFH